MLVLLEDKLQQADKEIRMKICNLKNRRSLTNEVKFPCEDQMLLIIDTVFESDKISLLKSLHFWLSKLNIQPVYLWES